MHVARQIPTTWQGRGLENLFARFDVGGRARRMYDRTRAPRILAGIRALGQRWISRFEKARSATQSPSARERMYEDLIVERVAGATPEELRQDAVELHQLINELFDDAPVTDADVLHAIARDNQAEARARDAEDRLLTRPDRTIDIGALEAVNEAMAARIAAGQEQLHRGTLLARQKRSERHGMRLVRGGPTA